MRVVVLPTVMAVGIVTVVGGCFDATLPEPLPPVACFVDDDCPGLLSCVDHLCRGADDDVRPPGVVADSVVVAPQLAGPGDTITVAFRTDEPVSGVPVVVAGDDAIVFSGGGSGDDVFAYAGRVGAVADGPLAITASLQDAAGNTGDAVLGVVVVDTTGPSVVDYRLPAAIASNTPVDFSFTADETLANAGCTLRAIGFGGGTLDEPQVVVTGAGGVCSFTLDGSVGASFELTLTMTDTAGNTSRLDDLVTLVITR